MTIICSMGFVLNNKGDGHDHHPALLTGKLCTGQKLQRERNPGFFPKTGSLAMSEKAGFLFLSCTQSGKLKF